MAGLNMAGLQVNRRRPRPKALTVSASRAKIHQHKREQVAN